MGCDIHPWVQWLEYPASGQNPVDYWSDWSGEMNWGRSYEFFTRLAGVRCHHEDKGDGEHKWNEPCPKAIVQPRGWPVKKPYNSQDHGDLHTPSWLTLEEFKQAAGDIEWPEVLATIAAMEAIEKTGHKTRLVFAFDN